MSLYFEKLNLQQSLRASIAALAIGFVVILAETQTAQAQTFSLIHTFTGGQDGYRPPAGLTMDKAGNLYGVTLSNEAFELKHKNSVWVFNQLYFFSDDGNGNYPQARVVFGPDGALYGTTAFGGSNGCSYNLGCGVVFRLRAQPTVCKTALCPWAETVLYRFTGEPDGAYPQGEVTFDAAGNIYLTTASGGWFDCGTVVELTPSNGIWMERLLYSFGGGQGDGCQPMSELIFDKAGNLYGTTVGGGDPSCQDSAGCGTIFQLTPSGSGWAEKVLWRFAKGQPGDVHPYAGLIFDNSGILYGATAGTAGVSQGAAFELALPSGKLSQLYAFQGVCCSGQGPFASLVMDTAGNLYGATYSDGPYAAGNIFKLAPSGGEWMYTDLYDFSGTSDGLHPNGPLVLNANGDLYGTTTDGGYPGCLPEGCGVVWEITP